MPIIGLSAFNQHPHKPHYSACQHFSHLWKPIRAGALYEALSAHLNLATPLSIKPPQTMSALSTLSNRHLKILLVEDNLFNQKVALHMLKRIGRQADVAGNGVEALAAVRHNAYDVILMDMQMPTMDGILATEQIRRLPINQQPHIIAMTASVLPEDQQRALAAGMNDFIAKPINAQRLAHALATIT